MNNGPISPQKNKQKRFWIYSIKYMDTLKKDQNLKNRIKDTQKKIKVWNKKIKKLRHQKNHEKKKCLTKYSM